MTLIFSLKKFTALQEIKAAYAHILQKWGDALN